MKRAQRTALQREKADFTKARRSECGASGNPRHCSGSWGNTAGCGGQEARWPCQGPHRPGQSQPDTTHHRDFRVLVTPSPRLAGLNVAPCAAGPRTRGALPHGGLAWLAARPETVPLSTGPSLWPGGCPPPSAHRLWPPLRHPKRTERPH